MNRPDLIAAAIALAIVTAAWFIAESHHASSPTEPNPAADAATIGATVLASILILGALAFLFALINGLSVNVGGG